jgi:hypothetical protein
MPFMADALQAVRVRRDGRRFRRAQSRRAASGSRSRATDVLARQLAQVMVQVCFDLSFGFGEKSQAPGVAQLAGGYSDTQRTKVPERVQQACAPSQFNQAALGPGQMFGFLVWRLSPVLAEGPDRRQVSACPWYSACAQTSPTWLIRISAPAWARSRSDNSASGAWLPGISRVVVPAQKACARPCQIR